MDRAFILGMKILKLILICGFVAWIIGFAEAAVFKPPSDLILPHNQLLIQVLGKCARLVKTPGQEQIYNACSACQVVNVSRKRPSNAVPTMRTYNVQGKSKFPLSFKGPGQTRITSESPCRGEAGSQQNLIGSTQNLGGSSTNKKPVGSECVSLERMQSGVIALINRCTSCRVTGIERFAINGKSLSKKYYQLLPNAINSLKPEGAADVSIIGEVACK